MASAVVRYNRAEFIETDTGNKVSRKCVIAGSTNIILGGKTIIAATAIIRGDLRRAGGSGPQVVVSIGKYCYLGEGCVVRPPYKTYKGVFSPYPVRIGNWTSFGEGSSFQAAVCGDGVTIGKNAIIEPLVIIKDFATVHENSVVASGTIIPSLTEWAGNPARQIGTLPESWPELVEARAKGYYARFVPE